MQNTSRTLKLTVLIILICFLPGHIVLCSHSLRHHRGQSSSPILSAAASMAAVASVSSIPALSSEKIEDKEFLPSAEMLLDSPALESNNDDDKSEDSQGLLQADAPRRKSSNVFSDIISESGSSEMKSSGNSKINKNMMTLVASETKIKPGHELKLKCDLNNTYGRIMWLHNGDAIRTDNGRYAIQGPNKNRAIEGRLTINNVLPEDNGIWQCHETKFDGKVQLSKPIRVIVMGKF